MGVEESANSGVGPVRVGHAFDARRLAAWMSIHVEGFRGPLEVVQFNGGQSNPTYKLVTPTKSYVLRRKPPGALLKGAHAIEREAQVLKALATQNFPVAAVHALCTDDAVIGTWFYIMDCVEGRIFWDATFPLVGASVRSSYFDAMNETIARLHAIDYGAAGLADFGRPGNYFARQVARWSKQYLEGGEAERDPNMDVLVETLPALIPAADETTLIHGDFRCDNMIFHPQEPRILAVLDWELSTLGNPLADFAYHAMMFRTPPNIVAGLQGADLAKLAIPSEADYVAAYCRRTGRTGIADYEFYLAFNFFRLAAIFHGIRGRVLRGTAASAQAAERAKAFPILARLARVSLDDARAGNR